MDFAGFQQYPFACGFGEAVIGVRSYFGFFGDGDLGVDSKYIDGTKKDDGLNFFVFGGFDEVFYYL